MCGIIGYIGGNDALPIILDGLQRLEYRGYDSAGLAVLSNSGLASRKVKGKLAELKSRVEGAFIPGTVGIGHTRWATHGKPSVRNAHPHFSCDRKIAVVHNGIIENYESLRAELSDSGHTFRSETDTEVIPHLIEHYFAGDLEDAVRRATARLEGSFAFCAITSSQPDRIAAVKFFSPLVIGQGNDATFVASDIPALLPYTRRVIFLDDGEIALVTRNSIKVSTIAGKRRFKKPTKIHWSVSQAQKEGYPHFMLKEIHEQPKAISATISGRTHSSGESCVIKEIRLPVGKILNLQRIIIGACGTSWHAGLVAKYFLEELARIPTQVELSSELRYAPPPMNRRCLFVAITQSGETADTIVALKTAKSLGALTLSICNVVGSSITRLSDSVIYTHAGPEIGVASTKAYVTQLTALAILAIFLGRLRKSLSSEYARQLVSELKRLPTVVSTILKTEDHIASVANEFKDYNHFLYLGRKYNLPTALEGALKLKELSYIHAEGYGAGEMKHGPIALIDERFPTVAIAVRGSVRQKMLSNIQEIKARGGKVIAVATEGDSSIRRIAERTFYIPETLEILSPIPAVVPLQLFAYHVATARGCDVDQPRNLAKSVTVE